MTQLPPRVSPDLRIEYEAGNEHSPTNPHGRDALLLHGDGSARLVHYGVGGQIRSSQGRVSIETLEALLTLLSRAGYPNVERRMLVPDETLRHLGVRCGAYDQALLMPWHQADELPAYRDAFRILDDIVQELARTAT